MNLVKYIPYTCAFICVVCFLVTVLIALDMHHMNKMASLENELLRQSIIYKK